MQRESATSVAHPVGQANGMSPAAGSPPAESEPEGRQLAWLPATVASISLRLAALDASLVYRDGEKPWRDCVLVRTPAMQNALLSPGI